MKYYFVEYKFLSFVTLNHIVWQKQKNTIWNNIFR